jgi:ABC-type transport system substrate-binding protein
MSRQRRAGRLTRRQFLHSAAAAAAFGAPALGTALNGEATPAARRGGTLVYASSADMITLDVPYVSDTISAAGVSMLYDFLVRYTPDLVIKPCLATNWTASGTSWTFRLRRGVRFHDGMPLDASAVKAHFDRLLGPEKPLRANLWLPYLDGVDVLDDSTLRLRTKFPDPAFLTRLADTTGAIESPAAVRRYGKDLARHPVGTGPFKFVEWVSDDRVVVARNDDYWGDRAYLDRVVVRPITDPAARVIALTSGDVQLAIHIPPEQLSVLSRDPRLAIETKETLRYLFVGMNVLKKPFNDVRVREALNYAVDKDAIVKELYQGLASALFGGVPHGAAGYAAVPGFRYDPGRAKQLLRDAGYPNGFSATMIGPKGRYLKDFELEQAIQQQLAAVGVTLRLENVEWARYLELLRMSPAASPLEIWLDAWSDVEAARIIENRWGCKFLRPFGANSTGFCNLELDRLVSQSERTLDQSARETMLKRAQEILASYAPSIWLLQIKEAAGLSRKLHETALMRTEVLTVTERTWLEA